MINTSDCKTTRVLKSIRLHPQWHLEHFKVSKTSSETPGLSKTFPDVELFRQEVFRSVHVTHLFFSVCEAMLPPAGHVISHLWHLLPPAGHMTSCDQWTPGTYIFFIITKLYLLTRWFCSFDGSFFFMKFCTVLINMWTDQPKPSRTKLTNQLPVVSKYQ